MSLPGPGWVAWLGDIAGSLDVSGHCRLVWGLEDRDSVQGSARVQHLGGPLLQGEVCECSGNAPGHRDGGFLALALMGTASIFQAAF